MTNELPMTEIRMEGQNGLHGTGVASSFVIRHSSFPQGFVLPSSFAIRHSSFQRGSALIAVFWMIFALGMVLFAATKALHGDTEYTRMMRGRIYAKRYAETGLELARHKQIERPFKKHGIIPV